MGTLSARLRWQRGDGASGQDLGQRACARDERAQIRTDQIGQVDDVAVPACEIDVEQRLVVGNAVSKVMNSADRTIHIAGAVSARGERVTQVRDPQGGLLTFDG